MKESQNRFIAFVLLSVVIFIVIENQFKSTQNDDLPSKLLQSPINFSSPQITGTASLASGSQFQGTLSKI